jgi:hypothetical protein
MLAVVVEARALRLRDVEIKEQAIYRPAFATARAQTVVSVVTGKKLKFLY